jgi:hypothetical protein
VLLGNNEDTLGWLSEVAKGGTNINWSQELVSDPVKLPACNGMDFKVKNGERYLGGFIGEPAVLDEWLDGKIQHWSKEVASLAAAATSTFPQSANCGLKSSLQQEW